MARSHVQFDPDKALQAILYITQRVSDPTFHRISKLMYLADKAHLAKYGRLIFGDTYVALKHGPVPSEIYDMLKAVRGDGWSAHMEEAKAAFRVEEDKQVVALKEAETNVFSESDLECLADAISRYGRLSFGALTDLSHDAAWLGADENDVIDIEEII